jgi:hypothetical protein
VAAATTTATATTAVTATAAAATTTVTIVTTAAALDDDAAAPADIFPPARCELCKQRKVRRCRLGRPLSSFPSLPPCKRPDRTLFSQVKCDRGQPSCGWCSRNNAICEYKERKKPGLRAGYGRELESRLDRLEAVLREHSEILQASFPGHAPPPPAFGPPQQSSGLREGNASLPGDNGTPRDPQPSSVFARNPQAETALFLQPPSSSFAQQAQPDFAPMPDGFSAGMTVPSAFSPPSAASGQSMAGAAAAATTNPDYYGRAARQPANLTSPNGPPPPGQSPSHAPGDQDQPPHDLLYALVDLYFKHINVWCPILHRNTTMESLFGPRMVAETDKILLNAIVAATLRFSADPRLTDDRRRHYHDVAKRRVVLHGMENSSVKALQAMVILALDLLGSSNGPPGWNIMALITRSVVHLGLAVEANSLSVSPGYASIYTLRAMLLPEPADFIEDEARRRLFWMVYLLDRYATISTAFDFALDDRDIDRTLPCRDDLWARNQKVETRWFRTDGEAESLNPALQANRPEHLGAFSYYLEVLGILSRIHGFLKRPVDISALADVEQWQMTYKELDKALTTFMFGLPGEYGSMSRIYQQGCNKTLGSCWVMLHAAFHTAVIRLHSSAAYPTTRSPIFAPSLTASQKCTQAAENVAALGDFVVKRGMLRNLGPPFAFTLWVAARLLLVHGSTVEHKLNPRIHFFVDLLRQMGRHWPVAARYCELLQRVLDEHRESESQGDGTTPSSVRILADMRRTAFDLDFLISRQPRHLAGAVAGATAEQPAAGAGPYASLPPARTPQPNELEYLDVFDFFNVPRLQMPVPGDQPGNGAVAGTGGLLGGHAHDGAAQGNGGGGGAANEFNITDFMLDANRDWLFKQESAAAFAGTI